MHLTKVRKLIFSLGPILIFLRTLVRFPSVMAWCRFILGYMAKSVCSCFLWPLSGMHKAYKKYSHLILYRNFLQKFGMPFMTISTNLCLFVKIVITFNYFLGKCHMFAMEKHNLLIWDVPILYLYWTSTIPFICAEKFKEKHWNMESIN